MANLVRIALVGVGVILAGILIGGLTGATAAPSPTPGPPLPVEVTNTPLPVTGSVSIGSGGTVNVGNTVSVNGTVQTAPATPFAETLQGSTSGPGTFTRFFTVPADKRLVIEAVSVSAVISGSDQSAARQRPAFHVQLSTGGEDATFYLSEIEQYIDSPGAFARWTGTQTLRLYADPGTTVALTVLPPNTYTSMSVNYSISGYLV